MREAEGDGRAYALLSILHEILPVLATILWLIAYAALLQKLRRERSAQGLSLQSLFALLVAETLTFAALICLLCGAFHDSVSLPLFCCQGVNCFLVLTTFSLAARNFSASYQAADDDFGRVSCLLIKSSTSGDSVSTTKPMIQSRTKPPSRLLGTAMAMRGVFSWHWLFLYVISGAAAVVIEICRARRSLPLWLSFLESFAGAVMALALLPQVRMFYKAGRQRIAASLGRFVVAMLLARIVSLTYWLTDRLFHGDTVMPGRGVRLITEGLNILILSDFTWNLYKSRIKQPSPLPL
eukprot:Gregarina_sp_Poly_1__9366@NODE_583_length_7383_cov_511_461318_g452_i0_p2_GENE_NODE_583_length_7383_cov_511_461318_g452_i0NODE_583_length_7383_cov_511_461318_g452_i0_p2_ORF_typecomplete_len295_score36_22ER_lumen_recept/PF00810_18/3_8e11PQloop/PF04193_14/0_019PQloop/PF04193_14/21Flu_M2/PF00599_17/11Flu_M2/PF00599_17/12Ceramidase/PF05875_12/62Ceramidase/PF05875_12/0_13DUF2921/PF11145_8/5_7e02DUF2921/PF11145_8/0_063DUF3955/PF13127_6/2_5e03DUF3955/PF13127_6/1_2DUF3955/PF13127_6/1_4e03_NODE_583_length